MTKEAEHKFESHLFSSQDGPDFDAEVPVKHFKLMGAGTWLITEAEKLADLAGCCSATAAS